MILILVWEKDKWFIDRISNKETDIQPRSPLFKYNEVVIYRKRKFKVEWANCTIEDNGNEIFWYDIKEGNNHSISCLESEIKTYMKR